MLFINETPPQGDLDALYERMAREGMVHSTTMCGEHYEPSESFRDEWAAPSVTWSAGGEEIYTLSDGRVIEVRPTGALTIAAGERYSYRASDKPFTSNMIVFPQWIVEAAQVDALTGDARDALIETRLIKPDAETERLMTEIVGQCRARCEDEDWYAEQLSLLFGRLLETQIEINTAPDGLSAAKEKTRRELARRADRAQQFILREYPDPALDIAAIASEACLSPYHLIRIFKELTGETPMRYLKLTRLSAAQRLLRDAGFPVAKSAHSVGYKDRAAFSRAFTAEYGVAPSEITRNG
ncbi:MAG: helix-turn-helix transcriptional regulator [Marinicaulis sp.]|nr:helix-turn-helix transcriptional regulator [Marinicaulis sp.]NNL88017.1 helix-turn-helix transcriptional regulator [Marinicaulis sp.]